MFTLKVIKICGQTRFGQNPGAILYRNTDYYSVALLEEKKKDIGSIWKKKNAIFFLLTLIKVQIN